MADASITKVVVSPFSVYYNAFNGQCIYHSKTHSVTFCTLSVDHCSKYTMHAEVCCVSRFAVSDNTQVERECLGLDNVCHLPSRTNLDRDVVLSVVIDTVLSLTLRLLYTS